MQGTGCDETPIRLSKASRAASASHRRLPGARSPALAFGNRRDTPPECSWQLVPPQPQGTLHKVAETLAQKRSERENSRPQRLLLSSSRSTVVPKQRGLHLRVL